VHHYPHHIGDYRKDTGHLSLLEHGAYRQLLDWYYLDEAPIPRETEVVFRRLCARTDEEQKAVEIVLREFFQATEKGWTHGRCDEEISIYQGVAERARTNGKLGGRPKKTDVVSNGKPRNNPDETQTKANQEPRTKNQEPVNHEEAIASSAPRRKRREAAEQKKILFDFDLGQWDGIEEIDASAWEEAYPAIHVETELCRAAEWVKANPANRKSNWRRFLTNWFSRAQDRAPRRAA